MNLRHTALLFTLIALLLSACTSEKKESGRDLDEIIANDTLRILTLYSSTSYFIYRDQEMGYEYELIKRYADSLGVETKVIVANSLPQLEEMLHQGVGDVIAYNIIISRDNKDQLLHCGRELVTHQVLVRQKGQGTKRINDVSELAQDTIVVQANTRYSERANNLNTELGGTLHVIALDTDTLTTEDLIEEVSTGKIRYTFADNITAQHNHTYFRNLDVHLPVSFPQRSSWAVNLHATKLASSINEWIARNHNSADYRSIMKRYFEYSKSPTNDINFRPNSGQLSHYDPLFKEYAHRIGWDWRLLAAIAYKESKFNAKASSWAGARGLMQLMPRTARNFGVSVEELNDPDRNIEAATRLLSSLYNSLRNVEDKEERVKFTLAAYNAGLGHISDAMALAKQDGRLSTVWEGNVAYYIQNKNNPTFYNNPVCKHGYLRGAETYAYVNEVLQHYEKFKTRVKQK